MSTAEKIEALKEEWLLQYKEELHFATRACESPIEQLFMLTCITRGWSLGYQTSPESWREAVWDRVGGSIDLPPDDRSRLDRLGRLWGIGGKPVLVLESVNGPDSSCRCIAQLPVRLRGRRGRIDFAFFLSGGTRVAVELDGHDFHERTKEQARAEKSRQRALTALGWHVLRFTGSEVYADAEACLNEVEDLPTHLRLEGGRRR